MEIGIHSVLDWSIAIISFTFAICLYYLSDKSISVKLFTILSIFFSLWSFFVGMIDLFKSSDSLYLTISTRNSYFLGILISTIFILFSFVYPKNKPLSAKLIYWFIGVEILFIYLIFFTDNIIFISNNGYWNYGRLWFLFDIYFISCWVIGIMIIFIKSLNNKDPLLEKSFRIMLFALVIGFLIPTITSVILPRLGIFSYDWVSPLSGFVWIILISYAISRHKLFDIKIITAEIAVFVLWIFILARFPFLEDVHEIIVETGLFIVSLIFGLLFIRSVFHEVRQREMINSLANELQTAYKRVRDLNVKLYGEDFESR